MRAGGAAGRGPGFRLAWPAGVRLFEVDLPGVLAFKEPVLAARGAVPRCERIVVPADLREDWPGTLTAAGFDPTRPAAWLTGHGWRPQFHKLATLGLTYRRPVPESAGSGFLTAVRVSS